MKSEIFTVKGFGNLNQTLFTLDQDSTVLDYTFNTVDRSSDDCSKFEYEFQVIYKQ